MVCDEYDDEDKRRATGRGETKGKGGVR